MTANNLSGRTVQIDFNVFISWNLKKFYNKMMF